MRPLSYRPRRGTQDQTSSASERIDHLAFTQRDQLESCATKSISAVVKIQQKAILGGKGMYHTGSRRVELNLSSITKSGLPVVPKFRLDSYSDRKPLVYREEQEMPQYLIRITPPKDQNTQRDFKEAGSPRTRVQTDYRKPENNSKECSPVSRKSKSEANSIYNQSGVKIRNQKKERNLIANFQQPVRTALHALKSNQTNILSVQELLREVQRQGGKFIDSIWPPNNSQLYNIPLKLRIPKVSFERISKIYNRSNVRILKQGDAINMVCGQFGSTRVHSALQILSEQTLRIMNIFHRQEINNEGLYYLNLCQDGVWRYIVVDDFLPVKCEDKVHLLFEHIISDNQEYQIWPALIEKAVAKVFGTYEDMQVMSREGIKTVFKLLTGYPCSEYSLNRDLKSFSLVINSCLKQKHIAVLQCLEESDAQVFSSLNLNPSASYQIIKIQDNILVLRNYQQEVFMDAEYEFEQMSIFDRLLIFKSHEDYVYTSCTLKHLYGYYSQIEISVGQETMGYFDVWQKNVAYFKPHLSRNDYQPCNYTIQLSQKQVPDEVLYIKESGIPVLLEPGVHVLRVHLCLEFEFDFTVSFYSQHEVEMVRINTRDKWMDGCC